MVVEKFPDKDRGLIGHAVGKDDTPGMAWSRIRSWRNSVSPQGNQYRQAVVEDCNLTINTSEYIWATDGIAYHHRPRVLWLGVEGGWTARALHRRREVMLTVCIVLIQERGHATTRKWLSIHGFKWPACINARSYMYCIIFLHTNTPVLVYITHFYS